MGRMTEDTFPRPRKILEHKNEVTRWYDRAGLKAGTPLPSSDVAFALWDLGRAESRGFTGCWAVFVNFRYDGLDEAVSEESRAAGGGWGRGQHVTCHSRVEAGQLVRDPSYPRAPACWSGQRSGYRCSAHVNFGAALCGYVTVPPGHPAHGVEYNKPDISVHGGLTYGKQGDDGGWTFGFDCSHYEDVGHPEFEATNHFRISGEYRDLGYVIAEIERLAYQLKAMEAPEEGR